MKNRKVGILIALVLILVATGTACARKTPAEQDAKAPIVFDAQKGFPSPKEITIRNVTKDEVTYSLVPYGSNAKPDVHKLAAGAIDRIRAVDTMTVSYEKVGSEVSFSLYPGKPYSFRLDSSGKIDIWQGSHGRGDAEDLAPFVPTPPEVVARMFELAKADKNSVVYDIGCGDGRIVVYAAKTFGARGVGIDIDPERIKESKENAKKEGVEKLVKFLMEDATKTDISAATIVTTYLLPESNELLRPKFERELRPGTILVTHNYIIPGWEGKEIDSATLTDASGTEHTIFLYKR
jgi:predicted O-methyltransferase YrrM